MISSWILNQVQNDKTSEKMIFFSAISELIEGDLIL